MEHCLQRVSQPASELSFKKALGLTLLLAALLLTVLSMIAGARELLTPQAWRRQGSTYKLQHIANEEVRMRNLWHLRAALWDYAKRHGSFPPHDWIADIPERLWHADENGIRYVYVEGREPDQKPGEIVVSEPPHFGKNRFVLLSTGEIKKLPSNEIRQATILFTR